MTSRQRRQAAVLVGLGIVLTLVVAWQFGWGTSAPAGARARQVAADERNGTGRTAPGAARRASAASTLPDPAALELELARLEAIAPEPSEATRDPFRFRPAAPPPPPSAMGSRPGGAPGMTAPSGGMPVEPVGPPVPPPPPPISYKFIGVLSQAETGRMAVLSDGKYVYHGREGDIIEGRYRIVKIGEESIQMEYVDGRGRQTIRLSGS